MENMDGKNFVEMCQQKLELAVLAFVGRYAKSVTLVVDGAGGHNVKTSIPALNAAATDLNRAGGIPYTLEYVLQPAQSSDYSTLDLATRFSLESRMDESTCEAKPTDTQQRRLLEKARGMWIEYDGLTLLSSIWRLLQHVHRQIEADNGGNDFEVGRK